MNPMLRQEMALARIAGLICTAAGIKSETGRKLTAADFMPFAGDREEEKEATEDDMKRMFGIKD